jgi:hypothetical protein
MQASTGQMILDSGLELEALLFCSCIFPNTTADVKNYTLTSKQLFEVLLRNSTVESVQNLFEFS